MDSVVVTIANPDTVMICLGEVVTLSQTNNVADAGLTWRPAEGFVDDVTTPNPRVAPVVSRYYVVTVGSGDMIASDSIYVQIDPLILPELIPDTTVCEGLALSLVQNPVVDSRGTTYDYSPGELLEDNTVANAIFPTVAAPNTTFTVVATSSTGMCVDSQSVTVSVTPSSLEIQQADTIFTCNDFGSETLTVNASPGNPEITWFPASGILSQTDNTIEVATVNDITYYATATVNGCPQIDSVTIRVDSLPEDLTLTAEPVKDPYCQGDTFYLLGQVFEVQDYPLVRHDWLNPPGLESPNELYNGVFTAQDTFLYRRATTNGACTDTAEIQINVTRPPSLIFDPADPVICDGEGEPFQVTATFDPQGPSGTVEWQDPNGSLSCTDCLDPIITTNTAVEYIIEITPADGECPTMEVYSVRSSAQSLPDLTDQTSICPGGSVQLIEGNVRDDISYSISGGDVMSVDPAVVVSPGETTTYTVTSVDPNCGETSQDITITVVPQYTVTLEAPTSVCVGETATLVAGVTPAVPGTFTFSLPAGGDVEGSEATVTVDRPRNYSVDFSDSAGCSQSSAAVDIEPTDASFIPQIVASSTNGTLLGDNPSVVRGGTFVLTIVNVPDGFGGSFNWAGGGDPATGEGSSITVTAPNGTESTVGYTVTIDDPDGCGGTAGISVILSDEVYAIPEIISANRDGLNDNFRVFFDGSASVDDFTLVVFNRWGQSVFESSDPAQGWDGTKNGKPQNLDTYLYLARFTVDGREIEVEGQFALVR